MVKKITIELDEEDRALLHHTWNKTGRIDWPIVGFWAEDGSPYQVSVPPQLADLLVGLQNRLSDAYMVKSEAKLDGPLFYIRSYKHDQHNLKGNELAMWWCPGGNGYTYDLAKAGKYTEAKAKEICGPMNMTTVGRGARARDEANNIMYPTAMIEALAMTTVNKFDADNRLRLALAEAGS
jgi:hypothetical protein